MTHEEQALRPIDKPTYRYWQALYLAFYSSRLYVDISKRWRGFGIRYLLFALAVFVLPLSIHTALKFKQQFHEHFLVVFEKLPTIYVQKGQVQFDHPMPYLVENKQGQVIGVVDTSADVANIVAQYPDLVLFVTQNKIYFRMLKPGFLPMGSSTSVGEELYEYAIEPDENVVFSGQDWLRDSGILNIQLAAQILTYPMLIGLFFGIYLVLLFLLGFLGQLFSSILLRYSPSLKESCRVLAVAATPQMFLLQLSLMVKPLAFPGVGLIHLALVAVYYSYAILSIKRESTQLVITE